ncbi:hypothetical protein FRC03_009866 [Tulasnella sp. 419]|nr:hypothetical protein FRC03_009866 [Tulasnella sp. 419]
MEPTVVALALSFFFGLYGIILWKRPTSPVLYGSRLSRLSPLRRRAGLIPPTPFYSSSAAYSLQRALNSFQHFDTLSQGEMDKRWTSFSEMPQRHRDLAKDIGYMRKLCDMETANAVNAATARSIASCAMHELHAISTSESDSDLSRAREALKHLVRDWSDEGAKERQNTIRPILDELEKLSPTENRSGARVLVPGSGLGRLSWEIAQLGFDVTANEFSYFMTIPFRFLLSNKTSQPLQHVIHPYLFNLSHQRTNRSLLRSVRFPDVVPQHCPNLHIVEADFLTLTTGAFDFVVTMFFIDTSVSIVDYLQQIHDLLTPGGRWINLGPLLWTSGFVSKMELSLEEVLDLTVKVGFRLEPGRRQVNTEYTANEEGMMRWIYEAEFWVATKL